MPDQRGREPVECKSSQRIVSTAIWRDGRGGLRAAQRRPRPTVRVTSGRTIPISRCRSKRETRIDSRRFAAGRARVEDRRLSSHRLDLQLNIYNFLNANTVQAVQTRSSSTYGQPLTRRRDYPAAAIIQLGATYRFRISATAWAGRRDGASRVTPSLPSVFSCR